jgi:hypothetical protein
MLAPISMMGGTAARRLDVCTDARSGVAVGISAGGCRVDPGIFTPGLGAHQRVIGGLVDVIGSREIAASVEPAHRNGNAATSTGGLAHDVSILLGVGRHLGSQPRANTSMTIMRAHSVGMGKAAHAGYPAQHQAAFAGRRQAGRH